MGRNQTSMKRGKLQSVVKQMRQVQTAAQKRRRLDKEREAAARNKEARNHKIAAERAKRMAGIDAEAAEVEARIVEFEKGRTEREAKLQVELEAKEAASVDAEPLPQPKI
jgi:hypothetical protein